MRDKEFLIMGRKRQKKVSAPVLMTGFRKLGEEVPGSAQRWEIVLNNLQSFYFLLISVKNQFQ